MNDDSETSLERLLCEFSAGKPGADARLATLIYDQLRAMARSRLQKRFGRQLAGVTFRPTEVAHEVLIRLIRQYRRTYANGDHFWAVLNTQLKRVLVDYYRKRKPHEDIPDDPSWSASTLPGNEAKPLTDALDQLRSYDARKADVVVCRSFLDFSILETAEALEISTATVERDSQFAWAWLSDELENKQ